MEAHFKMIRIKECGKAALMSLLADNTKAADRLLLSRYSYAVLEKTKKVLPRAFAGEDVPADARQEVQQMVDGISLPAERAREEALLNIVSPGIELPNRLAGDVATGFACAMLMATASSPSSRIALGLENDFRQTRNRVLEYRNQSASAEMREPIDIALKWLDAARLIATSDKPLTAEQAFKDVSLQR